MTVVLDQRKQSAVRRLLMAEPEAGAMLPSSAMDALVQLVGCDRYGIGEIDTSVPCGDGSFLGGEKSGTVSRITTV